MKKILHVALIAQGIAVAFGFLVYLGISELPQLQRQTFTILMNTKLILFVALYIAWRVTPPSTPPTRTEDVRD